MLVNVQEFYAFKIVVLCLISIHQPVLYNFFLFFFSYYIYYVQIDIHFKIYKYNVCDVSF